MYTVYTDGSCHPSNPGPGGWASVLIADGDEVTILKGGARASTNNIMELTAVIEALKTLKAGSDVEVITDSMYVKNGITAWIKKWRTNGWRTADKKPVKNKDLWVSLYELDKSLNITWLWTKAHAGNKYNEMVDTLAKEQAESWKAK